ncbi:MAG: cell wall hydrolase [Bacillota bacterium]|nr:cell wall hydrolase [Bacillota bacterium]
MLRSKKLKAAFVVASLSLLFSSKAFAGTYTVQKDDSLFKIGALFSSSDKSIMTANNLTSQRIYPGEVIQVPCKTYNVKSGDSLYKISKKNNVALLSLRKANNKWDDLLYPGQTLNLPAMTEKATEATTVDSTPKTTPESKDLDLLARLITAEAEDQPFKAKVAVGAVVINRVKNSEFADSISNVIYEKSGGFYQFTPVENGFIEKPSSSESREAAIEALQGYDPTNGAMFYFDDSTHNKWLWSKPIALRSGKMVFVY